MLRSIRKRRLGKLGPHFGLAGSQTPVEPPGPSMTQAIDDAMVVGMMKKSKKTPG
jgi:hypothetical protein